MMIWIWSLFGALVAAAGLRHWRRLRSRRAAASSRIDDAAVRQIIATGTLQRDDDPLDPDEIARAEREFWSESWDEPEEYSR